MDRLTARNKFGEPVMAHYMNWNPLIKRLCEYEDTAVSPQGIYSLLRMVASIEGLTEIKYTDPGELAQLIMERDSLRAENERLADESRMKDKMILSLREKLSRANQKLDILREELV